MKKSILFIIMLIFTTALLAQAPQTINYQAVARDAAGNLIANQDISFKLSILQGGPAGTVVYSESHLKTSNQFGLVTMEIGGGTVITGVFADIGWRNGPFYLKTEMDPNGGTTYQEMGVSQFISVPYAFWADTSGFAFDVRYHNTLDMAYDEGGPGFGRAITADNGAVFIYVPAGKANNGFESYMAGGGDAGDFQCTGATNAIHAWAQGNGIAGNFKADGVGNAIFAQTTNGAAAYTGVFLAQGTTIPINAEAQLGYGGRFVGGVYGLSNGINDAGYFVNNTAAGRAVYGKITNAANASDAIFGETNGAGRAGRFLNTGTGPGILGVIDETTNSNPSDAVRAITNGVGHAIYAQTNFNNNASQTIRAVQNGTGHAIMGDISLAAGSTNANHAIFGLTNGTGDAGHFVNTCPGAGGRAITGEITDPDNTQVAIYGKTVGDGQGIVGYITKLTNIKAAILGQTDGTGQGVLGLIIRPDSPATGVWGETAGNGIAIKGYISKADNNQQAVLGLTDGIGDAVRGTINNTNSTGAGVRGSSNAASPTVSSGVRAVGNGAERNAAALTLDNGAVRVAGNSRAAGKVAMGQWWNGGPFSDIGGVDSHIHLTGWSTAGTIFNDLIVPESYIQLTVEQIAYFSYEHYFAHINDIGTGFVDVVVTSMNSSMPTDSVFVHYWIVNPEPIIP